MCYHELLKIDIEILSKSFSYRNTCKLFYHRNAYKVIFFIKYKDT